MSTFCTGPEIRACYRFEEGTGTTVGDGSGNSNNGTADTTNWVMGHTGLALSFSGSATSEVIVPRSSSLEPKTAITVEAWIKPSIVGIDGLWDRVVDKGVNTGYGLALGSGGFGVGACFRLASAQVSTYICGNTLPPANLWTHIAGTWNGTTITVWVNGVADGSTSFSGPIEPTSLDLHLGNRAEGPGGGTYAFNGAIDDVRIYARAKSATEVCAAAGKSWIGTVCQ